jgi:gamma-glutamyltranspeptidase/glutathione hydrolase
MIATPHFLASEAGLDVLLEGGTAMDAAIAANAVLTVLYPDQTSVGGDCFFLVYDPESSAVVGWNGSGPAPLAASRDELLSQGYSGMPRRGPYAVTVPGTVDAWFAGHGRYGSLEMSRLLEPAIGYARDGFPVSPRLSGAIAAQAEVLPDLPYLRDVMLIDGRVPDAGETLAFPKLARSFELIAESGRDVFYSGSIAEAVAAHMTDLGGWLSADDLAAFRGEWVEPISIDYRGTTVVGFPPNSQGITSLIGLGLLGMENPSGEFGAADDIHAQIEAKKRAFSVRDFRLGDPRFVDIDTDELLSRPFLKSLWSDYDPRSISTGQADRAGDTVYLCAVDRDGLAVSLIQSMYQAFGSGIADPETGIILHNRGSYFSLNSDSPNVLEPGKRPLHTLMPAMLLRDGDLLGPVGTQGGDVQAQVHIQLIADLIDYGMEPQEAIDAPRWISGGANGPNEVLLEHGLADKAISGLAERGHGVTIIDAWNGGAGHAQMIMRDPDTGELVGGADPRADGLAVGH